MSRYLSGLLRPFVREETGGVVLLFGLTLLPVMFGIGLSVDYGRALTTKNRLGQAIDAAALAAASWTDLDPRGTEAKAMEYIEANFPPEVVGSIENVEVNRTKERLTIEASAEVETSILKVAGIDRLDVDAFSEVALRQKKIELVMVLDNTGSMAWSNKIVALKNAAHTLVETLKSGSAASANNENVKIGLVPFAAGVNIGPDKLDEGWIDADAKSIIAGEDFEEDEKVNVLDLYKDINNRKWEGCVRARDKPYDTLDTPPGSNPDTLWVPYFAPDEPDTDGSYRNDYADDGVNGDEDERQRNSDKYEHLTISIWSPGGPDYNCTVPEVTPLTQIKGEAISGVETMIASGSTVIPAGLAWGWRLISPGEPYTEGAAYDDDDVIKAIVLLTDGQNDVGGGSNGHNGSYYSAYGFAQSEHLGSENGWQAEEVLDEKTETLCTNVKDEGIRLYTITFQLSDGPIKDLMRGCATEPSMYYDSPSNDELRNIFETIAKDLNDLRLSK